MKNPSNETQKSESNDPFLDEIHAIKRAVSEEFDHDVVRLARQLQKDQETYASRLVRNPRNKAKAS